MSKPTATDSIMRQSRRRLLREYRVIDASTDDHTEAMMLRMKATNLNIQELRKDLHDAGCPPMQELIKQFIKNHKEKESTDGETPVV